MGDILFINRKTGETIRLTHADFETNGIADVHSPSLQVIALTAETETDQYLKWQMAASHPNEDTVAYEESELHHHNAWVSIGTLEVLLTSGDHFDSVDYPIRVTHETGPGTLEAEVRRGSPEIPSGI